MHTFLGDRGRKSENHSFKYFLLLSCGLNQKLNFSEEKKVIRNIFLLRFFLPTAIFPCRHSILRPNGFKKDESFLMCVLRFPVLVMPWCYWDTKDIRKREKEEKAAKPTNWSKKQKKYVRGMLTKHRYVRIELLFLCGVSMAPLGTIIFCRWGKSRRILVRITYSSLSFLLALLGERRVQFLLSGDRNRLHE